MTKEKEEHDKRNAKDKEAISACNDAVVLLKKFCEPEKGMFI